MFLSSSLAFRVMRLPFISDSFSCIVSGAIISGCALLDNSFAPRLMFEYSIVTFSPLSKASRNDIVWESISVDAACSGNPGLMEYRGVDTKSGIEFFRQGPFPQGTNNVGEFLALVHGLAHLKRQGSNLPIYTDSRIAMGWIDKKVFRSKLKRTATNAKIFELADRALHWLKTNDYDTKIMKWETKSWGEIPADFGRK